MQIFKHIYSKKTKAIIESKILLYQIFKDFVNQISKDFLTLQKLWLAFVPILLVLSLQPKALLAT